MIFSENAGLWAIGAFPVPRRAKRLLCVNPARQGQKAFMLFLRPGRILLRDARHHDIHL